MQSLKSIRSESQDGVSSHKIGRNSKGTGMSSSQPSQTKAKHPEEEADLVPIIQKNMIDHSENSVNNGNSKPSVTTSQI